MVFLFLQLLCVGTICVCVDVRERAEELARFLVRRVELLFRGRARSGQVGSGAPDIVWQILAEADGGKMGRVWQTTTRARPDEAIETDGIEPKASYELRERFLGPKDTTRKVFAPRSEEGDEAKLLRAGPGAGRRDGSIPVGRRVRKKCFSRRVGETTESLSQSTVDIR